MGNLTGLRMDDVGVCTKRYEVYSDVSLGYGRFRISGNWLFLKYIPHFRKWGPYRELTSAEWEDVFKILDPHNAKLTVAVTAAWTESQDDLIPFPEKFPDEARILKEGSESGLIERANHGLTHCVLENNIFKPGLFSGNRLYHREFYKYRENT